MSRSDAEPIVAPDELAVARWQMLTLMSIAIVLSMTVWFSATAIVPELTDLWRLEGTQAAWMTNGVQVGFVAGALGISVLGLADFLSLRLLIGGFATIAALANTSLLFVKSPDAAIVARMVTGMALAGVYPPSLKLISTWFRRGRGMALGIMLAALTLGSAMPHLVRGFTTSIDWESVVIVTSSATGLGAAIILLKAREGPYPFVRSPFSINQILGVLSNRSLMLANLGYFGHMWELYAFWGWLLTYSAAALAAQGIASPYGASFVTFGGVAAGVVGCILGGWMSDRYGRTATCILMMSVSAFCSMVIGLTFAGPTALFIAVVVVWGMFVIGDSAQFSAIATEVSDTRYVGTALTLQMSGGFALTILSIWLTSAVAHWLGDWRWTFLVLMPGPLIGIVAMMALRRRGDAVRIAHGLR